MPRLEAAQVRAACRQAGWCAVLNGLAGDQLASALNRPGRHVACPVHGGVHGDGFRLFADVATTGGGICATCGAFPDGFALLQWLFGWSFPQTLERVAAVLRLDSDEDARALAWASPTIDTSLRTSTPKRRRASATLARLWSEAIGPDQPGAVVLHRYLAGRGLVGLALDPDVIRLHPALPYWTHDAHRRSVCTGSFPALLALVRSPSGEALSLHRTYLRADGQGKAPVPAPRKLLPAMAGRSLSGSAVRLLPAGESLGIAEGLETALAASALSGMPVWACLSATLMQRFVPPAGVHHLTVWVDKDRSTAGSRAAAALRDRLRPGLAVTLRSPADPIPADMTSLDWADVWHSRALRGAA